jgi:hypothetical protein
MRQLQRALKEYLDLGDRAPVQVERVDGTILVTLGHAPLFEELLCAAQGDQTESDVSSS